jgi:hypothetical protein
MANAKPLCLALVLSAAALALSLGGTRPQSPGHLLMAGPLDEGVLRSWAARSDWSSPPASGEPVEWRGAKWRVVDAEAGSLQVRPIDDNDSADRVVPVGEARLIGLSRALPSGEVVTYRLHAVREAE